MADGLRDVSLTNLAAEFEQVAGEPIAYAVLSVSSWRETPVPVPADKAGVVLTWDEARPYLDYGFDLAGWDGPNVSTSAMAWSDGWVVFVHEYDSAHSVMRVPRYPTDGYGGEVGG